MDPRLRGDDRKSRVDAKKKEAVRWNGLCALELGPRFRGDDRFGQSLQLHPVVAPQDWHFRQEPFRTIV
jgi:hypothetical protein